MVLWSSSRLSPEHVICKPLEWESYNLRVLRKQNGIPFGIPASLAVWTVGQKDPGVEFSTTLNSSDCQISKDIAYHIVAVSGVRSSNVGYLLFPRGRKSARGVSDAVWCFLHHTVLRHSLQHASHKNTRMDASRLALPITHLPGTLQNKPGPVGPILNTAFNMEGNSCTLEWLLPVALVL